MKRKHTTGHVRCIENCRVVSFGWHLVQRRKLVRNAAIALCVAIASVAQAGLFAVVTPVADPPSKPFLIDTDLNAPPLSDTWASYALGFVQDGSDNYKVYAVDVTLNGQFHQRWGYDTISGTFVPSPYSTNITSGDSHLIPGSIIPVPDATENNNVSSPLPSAPDTATRDYGVGTMIHGNFGYSLPEQAAQIPGQVVNVAYVVVPKGLAQATNISVKVFSNIDGTNLFRTATFTNSYFGGAFCPASGCLNARVDVRGNGISIPDDSFVPAVTNNSDFGTVIRGSVQQRTFTIHNPSDLPLTLGSPALTGPFSVLGTFPSSVPGHSSTSFTVGLGTATYGQDFGSIAIPVSDPTTNDSYNFSLGADVIPARLHGIATLIKSPPGAPFNAPESDLPPGWVAFQLSLQAQPGDVIGAVDVHISGPIHQRWIDTDFDGVTDPSPLTSTVGDGRGDSHLTAPTGSPFGSGPTETNPKTGSPLISTPGVIEYGVGGQLSGAWAILSPKSTADLAYIVIRRDQLSMLQITVKSATPSGDSYSTLTANDFDFTPEPSSITLMSVAMFTVMGVVRRRETA